MSNFDLFDDQNPLPIQERILKYEKFVEEVLKRDLARVSQRYERICETIADYMTVKASINAIQADETSTKTERRKPIKTMSDLGSNCYVKCVIPESDRIYLNIGLDCFLELSLAEALRFIEQRVNLYQKDLEIYVKHSAKIKAHIKLILNMIDQLRESG